MSKHIHDHCIERIRSGEVWLCQCLVEKIEWREQRVKPGEEFASNNREEAEEKVFLSQEKENF